MTRTSITHPLQIAEIGTGPGQGRIGVTFCPGKKQPSAATGAWDRDLGLDVQTIADWGAVAVLTLIEDHEIRTLKVEGLGEAVRARHMDWLHLPITDVSTPDHRSRRHGKASARTCATGFAVASTCWCTAKAVWGGRD
jgi:ADP-ribosyl-[dinitrogen reductase] hydrolase